MDRRQFMAAGSVALVAIALPGQPALAGEAAEAAFLALTREIMLAQKGHDPGTVQRIARHFLDAQRHGGFPKCMGGIGVLYGPAGALGVSAVLVLRKVRDLSQARVAAVTLDQPHHVRLFGDTDLGSIAFQIVDLYPETSA